MVSMFSILDQTKAFLLLKLILRCNFFCSDKLEEPDDEWKRLDGVDDCCDCWDYWLDVYPPS
jgi:hypothetical protein